MWACAKCGGTDVWELSYVRSNRISWMLDYEDDVIEYEDAWPNPQSKCMNCAEIVHIIEIDKETT
tara:strand:- start:211 stop:405 length:195 start_codon:yes stop_codon:yes gene_type:complete